MWLESNLGLEAGLIVVVPAPGELLEEDPSLIDLSWLSPALLLLSPHRISVPSLQFL